MDFRQKEFVPHQSEAYRPFAGRRRGSSIWIGGLLVCLLAGMLAPFFLESGRPGDEPADEAVPVSGEIAEDPIGALGKLFAHAADRVTPAVVSVINYSGQQGNGAGSSRPQSSGLGSGIIFDRVGRAAYVATNHHVISGGDGLEVVLTDGSRREAELVGSDLFSDLAVLSIDSEGIDRVAVFGDSGELEVGEFVMAIGNPLGLSYSHTHTAGIISSLRTPVPVSLSFGQVDWEMDMIQTDAAINRGNSGGALVNLNGEVVGINSMKVSDFGVEGLGFAIPINEAREIIDSLLAHGKVLRPFLGIAFRDLNLIDRKEVVPDLPGDVKEGVVVLSADGPAAEAGLAEGDVIVQMDEAPIGSSLELRKYLYEQKKIGDRIHITFYRGDTRQIVQAILEERD